MKKEYIWNLQNQFIRMGSEKILFERVTLFGSYVETREYRAQECSIVRTENHGFCIYIGGIDRVGLKPKKEMSYFLLQFYAKCFSLKMKKIPIFKECDNLEDIVSNYQFFKPSCIYLFIQKHREIIWKIALGILIFLAAAYLFYIVAASQNWFDIGEWMKQEIA